MYWAKQPTNRLLWEKTCALAVHSWLLPWGLHRAFPGSTGSPRTALLSPARDIPSRRQTEELGVNTPGQRSNWKCQLGWAQPPKPHLLKPLNPCKAMKWGTQAFLLLSSQYPWLMLIHLHADRSVLPDWPWWVSGMARTLHLIFSSAWQKGTCFCETWMLRKG